MLDREKLVRRKINLPSAQPGPARAPSTLAGPRNPLDNEQLELRLPWLTLGALETDRLQKVLAAGTGVERSHRGPSDAGKARADPQEAGELGEEGTDRREGWDRAEQTRDAGKEGA